MIVTAWIHPDDLTFFHRARSKFFPGHRNFLSAHLTLFHHIRSGVRDRFREVAAQQLADFAGDLQPLSAPFTADGVTANQCLSLHVKPPFSMGRGVAYGVEAAPLIALRTPLRDHFAATLTDQDARPWKKPHLTVQNKVDKATANRLARHLLRIYAPCEVRVLGLEFFRYDYGPWTLLGRVGFE